MMLSPKCWLNLFQGIYEKENERKYKIHAGIVLPTSIIVVLAGALAYVFKNFPRTALIDFYIHLVLVFLFLIPFGFSIFYLIRVVYNYEYGYITSPKGIWEYINDLHEYYLNVQLSEKTIDKQIREDIDEHLLTQYIEYGELAASNNDRKSYYVHKTHVFIVIAIIFFFINFSFLFYSNNKDLFSLKANIIRGESRDVTRETETTVTSTPETTTTTSAKTENTTGQIGERRGSDSAKRKEVIKP